MNFPSKTWVELTLYCLTIYMLALIFDFYNDAIVLVAMMLSVNALMLTNQYKGTFVFVAFHILIFAGIKAYLFLNFTIDYINVVKTAAYNVKESIKKI